MRKICHVKILRLNALLLTCFIQIFSQTRVNRPAELEEILKKFPITNEFLINAGYEARVETRDDIAAFRFNDRLANKSVYIAWSKTRFQQTLNLTEGSDWVMNTAKLTVSTPFSWDQVPVLATPVYIVNVMM